METLLMLVGLTAPLIALTVWGIVRLERRDRRKDVERMDDHAIFKATASIHGTQGTISDIEFGAKLDELMAEAKARGCRGLDVAWLDRSGKQVNRTTMDF